MCHLTRVAALRGVLGFWIAAVAACLPPAPAAAAEPALRFGSVAMDIPAEMYRRLTPLTDYLAQELGRPVALRLSPDMNSAIDALVRGDVDLAYLTPVAYIDAHARSGVRLIVKTVTQGKSSFRLMIVVRDQSPIRQVRDLRGRSFAFGDRAAILQRAVVVGAGMPLERLGEYRFIGHYDNIAQGVHRGDFDAGILKDTTAYKWRGRGLRVLYASPDLPPYNIAARSGMSDELLDRVRRAFLRLDARDPKYRAVIQTLDPEYDGFVAAKDEDYDVVRRLIAPFAGGK